MILLSFDFAVSLTPLSFDLEVSMTPLSFDSAVSLTLQSHGIRSYTKWILTDLAVSNGSAKFWLRGVNDTAEIWLSSAIDTAESWLSGVIGDLKLKYLSEFAAVFENILRCELEA